jgi:hypothetical protein
VISLSPSNGRERLELARVFFSYSHKDEELRDRLEVQLAMLKRQGDIEVWHDRRLTAGDDFAGSINEELERADIILLLVSPDFLASQYCYDVEMSKALSRHESGSARVIPIILRHCEWHRAPFGKLLAAPKDGKPVVSWPDLDEAFLDVVRQIRSALPRSEPRATRIFTSGATASVGPRSSNLRIAKTFSEADKDRFLDEGFGYIERFFENSLRELQERNQDIETSFRRIDATKFTAVVYRKGKALARCKIQIGGMFGAGISYSNSDRASDNSCNEQLRVEVDNEGLFLKALGFGFRESNSDRNLTFEGASEYFWSLLIEPLQTR